MRKICLVSLILILSVVFSGNICSAKNTHPSSKGYVGTLPDLTRNVAPKENTKQPVQDIPSKYFNSENSLKPVPEDNPTFVNIILKPDTTSKYVKDLQEFIPILENLSDIIDDNDDVQIFNAKVYFFNTSADYFRDKYLNKPESISVTYKKLMELNTHARSVALLRSEAIKYNPYLAYHDEGYVYNPNNVQKQIDYLKAEIQQTILLLRDAK